MNITGDLCFVMTSVTFSSTMNVRKVEKTVLSVEQSEGVGARVRRSIGRKEVRLRMLMQLNCHHFH